MSRFNIVNLRGTSGCGKTTIVQEIMGRGLVADVYSPSVNGRPPKVQDHVVTDVVGLDTTAPLHVLGRYITACGGCDTIKTQDEICDRVRQYHPLGPVLFEGLLISHLFSRYTNLSDELGGITFLFLDTSLDTCLARVKARREARGNTKPLDPTNTTQKWNDMRRVFAKMEAAQMDCRWVSGTDLNATVDTVLGVLDD